MSDRRALFLDRDGVINHDSGYTSKLEDFIFIDGIFDLCRAATEQGFLLIVVTNQAGIGRGYYSEQDFLKLTQWMCERFKQERAPIRDVFHCPYHPVHGLGRYKIDSNDRKPNPGMLMRAASAFGIDMSRSIMIGDKDSDMQAAISAGVAKRVHYLPNWQREEMSLYATHGCRTLHGCTILLEDPESV